MFRPRQSFESPNVSAGTRVNDLRVLCEEVINTHRRAAASLQARASALVKVLEKRPLTETGAATAKDPVAGKAGGDKPALPTSSTAAATSTVTPQVPQNRAECALRVLERLACIRHELNRAEEALQFREQQPCEAKSDTEAWLLRLLRGPAVDSASPEDHLSPKPLHTSTNTASTRAAHLPEPCVTQGVATAASSGSTTSQPHYHSSTSTTAPNEVTPHGPSRHADGRMMTSPAHRHRQARRASSVNLPEFASVTSTSTDFSADAAQRAHLARGHRSRALLTHASGTESDDDSSGDGRRDHHAPVGTPSERVTRTEEIARGDLDEADAVPVVTPPGDQGAPEAGNPISRVGAHGELRAGSASRTEARALAGRTATGSSASASPGERPSRSDTPGLEGRGQPSGRDAPVVASLHSAADAPPPFATRAATGQTSLAPADPHQTPDVTGREGACVPDTPRLSMFERRRLRLLLGGVATDIVAVAILMDELGTMATAAPASGAEYTDPASGTTRTAEPITTPTANRGVAREGKQSHLRHKSKTTTGTARHASLADVPSPQAPLPSLNETVPPTAPSVAAAAATSSALLSESGRQTPTSAHVSAPESPVKAAVTASHSSGQGHRPTSVHTPPPPPPNEKGSVGPAPHVTDASTSPIGSRAALPVPTMSTPPTPPSAKPVTDPSTPPQWGSSSRRGAANRVSPLTTSIASIHHPPPSSAPPPPSASAAGGTGSILYRSPFTANRALVTPPGGERGRPGPTPIMTTNNASSVHTVPSAVSFLDPGTEQGMDSAGCAQPCDAATGQGSTSKGCPRHLSLDHLDGLVLSCVEASGLLSAGDDGASIRPSSASLNSPCSQPRPRDEACPPRTESESSLTRPVPRRHRASRTSPSGASAADDTTGALAARCDSGDAVNAVAAAVAAGSAAQSRLSSGPLKMMNSPTATLRHPSERGGVGSAEGSVYGSSSVLGGAGGTFSRPMSRTASMIRRPRKLDVTASNTKEIAPLVHHYRVISQGGASSHSAVSSGGGAAGSGTGAAHMPLTAVLSGSSFHSGAGAVAAGQMLRTPSFESLVEDLDALHLSSPHRPLGAHQRAASFSAGGAVFPKVDAERASPTSLRSAHPVHTIRRTSSAVMAPTGSGGAAAAAVLSPHSGASGSTSGLATSCSFASGVPVWSAAGATAPNAIPSNESSCESGQGHPFTSPPTVGLRGTNSSFYATRALTPIITSPRNLRTTAGATAAGQPRHQRLHSSESADLTRQPGRTARDGGSVRSRSGCASPLSSGQHEVDGSGVVSVPSTTAVGASGVGGGSSDIISYSRQRSASASSTERSWQSNSFASRAVGEHVAHGVDRRILPRAVVQFEDSLEGSKYAQSPPLALATVGPRAGQDTQLARSFGSTGGGGGGEGSICPSSEETPTAPVAIPRTAPTLLTTLRPGEVVKAEASATVAPFAEEYEVNADQLTQFLRYLFMAETMEYDEADFDSAGLVYCIPGVRRVPAAAAHRDTASNKGSSARESPTAGDREDAMEGSNWLLPVVPGDGMEPVRLRDLKRYVQLVKAKVKEVEATTGLQLLPQ